MSELRNTWVNSLPEQVLENTQDIAELQQDATDEAINRENADNALQNQITAEVSAREAADQNLQQQINELETSTSVPQNITDLSEKLIVTSGSNDTVMIFAKENDNNPNDNASALFLGNNDNQYNGNYARLQARMSNTTQGVNRCTLNLQYTDSNTPEATITVVENGSTTKTVDLLSPPNPQTLKSLQTTFGNLHNQMYSLTDGGAHKVLFIEFTPTNAISGNISTEHTLQTSSLTYNAMGFTILLAAGDTYQFNLNQTSQYYGCFMFSATISQQQYGAVNTAPNFINAIIYAEQNNTLGCTIQYNHITQDGNNLTFGTGYATLDSNENVTIYYI